MAESRYEKYIVRKPAIVMRDYSDKVPRPDKIRNESPIYTGIRVMFSKKFVQEANSMVEYCYISGDITLGTGQDFEPHKHDYGEIFLFLGTNTEDTSDLGAEVEFWLGEGEELEKVVFNTSSSLYIPPGVAHYPQIWRNVRRPVMMVVVIPTSGERILKLVPLEGRRI